MNRTRSATAIDHTYWGKRILQLLVSHVESFSGGHKYLTYGELAKQIGYPPPHTGNLFGSNIGDTLGVMGHLFDDIVVDGQRVPMIQSLAVAQRSKLPSDGLKEFYPAYPSLSRDKKRDLVGLEYRRIFTFGDRWNRVLEALAIRPLDGRSTEHRDENPGHGHDLTSSFGSEGSPQHRALRDFIAANPSAVGLDPEIPGVVEYPLKSGDCVDVVFEGENEVVGVEVKSSRSGFDDLQRGLFQTVKYKAILDAEIRVRRGTRAARCLLVLEGRLPRGLFPTRKRLQVEVWEEGALG